MEDLMDLPMGDFAPPEFDTEEGRAAHAARQQLYARINKIELRNEQSEKEDPWNVVGEFESLYIEDEDYFENCQHESVEEQNNQLDQHLTAVDESLTISAKEEDYVYEVSDDSRIKRFLILGCSEGKFYTAEKELTIEDLSALIEIINKGNSGAILRNILDISTSGRNPKPEPLLMALALCAKYRVEDLKCLLRYEEDKEQKYFPEYLLETHRTALKLVNQVCRIPTHLFMFVHFSQLIAKKTNSFKVNKSKGWGRSLRQCISEWYSSKSPEQLAKLISKNKQWNGWTHKDLFRLSHPIQNKHGDEKLVVDQLYQYVAKGSINKRKRRYNDIDKILEPAEKRYSEPQMDLEESSEALNLIEASDKVSAFANEEVVVREIEGNKCLFLEHIPAENMNSIAVWQALLDRMSLCEMIRNLGKMTSVGALAGEYVGKIVDELLNTRMMGNSSIPPITILLAKLTYENGRGSKGVFTWDPVPEITRALAASFDLRLHAGLPTKKRICLAFDVSNSMTSLIPGTLISCRTASAALAMTYLRNEASVDCVGVGDSIIELAIDKNWDITQICDNLSTLRSGITDCAQPILWATKERREYDVFVVFTDNKTDCGDVHPDEALRGYRAASGIASARLAIIGMTAEDFSIADPHERGMLDIVGFNSSVPMILKEFIEDTI